MKKRPTTKENLELVGRDNQKVKREERTTLTNPGGTKELSDISKRQTSNQTGKLNRKTLKLKNLPSYLL